MNITVEISYYPLKDKANEAISLFLQKLENIKDFDYTIQTMSTLLVGDYNEIMTFLTKNIFSIMEQFPSVFVLKISNACPV